MLASFPCAADLHQGSVPFLLWFNCFHRRLTWLTDKTRKALPSRLGFKSKANSKRPLKRATIRSFSRLKPTLAISPQLELGAGVKLVKRFVSQSGRLTLL